MIATTIITNVLNTLKLCNHLKSLSQPLSLALFVSGIIINPKKEKLTATMAAKISNVSKSRKSCQKSEKVSQIMHYILYMICCILYIHS